MSSIDRKCHLLIREKSLAMPRNIILFDTETKPQKLDDNRIQHNLKLGWSVFYRRGYGRNLSQVLWQDFYDSDTFWRFVFEHCEAKKKLWVIARQLTFDFTVLEGWRYLRKAGYKVKFFHTKGTTTIISVRCKGKSILFVDSLNWFRESIQRTGERIGLSKLSIDFETCTDDYLSIYCRRDVEIELANIKSFIEFLEGNTISRLCYTLGSTAMAAYLLNHYHEKIYIHNNEQAIGLERESYKGGRVECFYIGDKNDGNYYVLDVNSLYPFVMRNNPYPVKYKKILHQIRPAALHSLLKSNSAVAKVLIQTDEPAYAIRRERTIFPVGRFWTTLTTPELKFALDRGNIVKVGDCVVYEQANIFCDYVDKLYGLRMDFKSAGIGWYEVFCKYLLNALYGKFGQKGEIWTKIGDCPNEPDRVELLFVEGEKRTRQIRYLLGEVFELTGYEECFNSFPAIAAHVTAYGRLYLWDLIKQAGLENVLYCDTDSLIVNEVGLCRVENQIDDKKLGFLKIEYFTGCLSIRGLKDYSTDNKQVIKGIRKNAVEIQTGVYEQEKWPSFRGTLRSSDANVYTVEKITKVLHRKYTKGHVSINGTVTPFSLAEPCEYVRQLL